MSTGIKLIAWFFKFLFGVIVFYFVLVLRELIAFDIRAILPVLLIIVLLCVHGIFVVTEGLLRGVNRARFLIIIYSFIGLFYGGIGLLVGFSDKDYPKKFLGFALVIVFTAIIVYLLKPKTVKSYFRGSVL
jgi:hypothetical protein